MYRTNSDIPFQSRWVCSILIPGQSSHSNIFCLLSPFCPLLPLFFLPAPSFLPSALPPSLSFFILSSASVPATDRTQQVAAGKTKMWLAESQPRWHRPWSHRPEGYVWSCKTVTYSGPLPAFWLSQHADTNRCLCLHSVWWQKQCCDSANKMLFFFIQIKTFSPSPQMRRQKVLIVGVPCLGDSHSLPSLNHIHYEQIQSWSHLSISLPKESILLTPNRLVK